MQKACSWLVLAALSWATPARATTPSDAAASQPLFERGRQLGDASLGLPLPVDPGSAELVVECPGRHPRRSLLSIAEGERLELCGSCFWWFEACQQNRCTIP